MLKILKKGNYSYPRPSFPVGSIYLTVENINPADEFGGKWELIAQGRTLVGVDPNDTDFNAPKKVFGEKEHKLTVEEMPKHKPQAYSDNTNYSPIVDTGKSDSVFGLHFNTDSGYRASPGDFRTIGNDEPHNNVQPSFACYIWCRIA